MYKIPKKVSKKELIKFFKSYKLEKIIESGSLPDESVNSLLVKKPYKAELEDLYRLFKMITLNKRTTILEFGCGWSSLIFSIALSELKKKFEISNLRRNNPFELFVLDNEKYYLNNTKKKIEHYKKKLNLKNRNHFIFSNVQMALFKGRVTTEYSKLPICNPDFIYLDGPDQFNIKGNVNGINLKHNDMLPMANDLVKIEYFLTPGTIIVVDGRTANARFLKDHFKRKWHYKHYDDYDQHIFYLDEKPLGKFNKLQLEFYKKKI